MGSRSPEVAVFQGLAGCLRFLFDAVCIVLIFGMLLVVFCLILGQL